MSINRNSGDKSMSVVIQKCACALYEACIQGKPIECFSKGNINLTLEEGYEIQDLVIKKKIEDNGENTKGYKLGLTTKETQRIYNTESPFYGTLTNTNIISNEVMNIEDLFEPFVIEMELMFIIEEDLSYMADEQEILEKTKIAPGIEIPDGRYENWTQNKDLASILADTGVTGRIVVGKPVKYSSINDLKDIKAILYLDDKKLDEGCGSVVLGNPINSMIWLVNKLSMQGKKLTKGMIVSSGTMIMPKPLIRGKYKAEFSGIGEITLKVK